MSGLCNKRRPERGQGVNQHQPHKNLISLPVSPNDSLDSLPLWKVEHKMDLERLLSFRRSTELPVPSYSKTEQSGAIFKIKNSPKKQQHVTVLSLEPANMAPTIKGATILKMPVLDLIS